MDSKKYDLTEIDLAKTCRHERKEQAISQTELAEKSGLTLYRIHALENGGGAITLEEALKILEALGFEILINGYGVTADTIGIETRKNRVYRDMTQNDVVRESGVSKSTVRKTEEGRPVRFENAQAVMAAVDLRPEMTLQERPKKIGDLSRLCRQLRQEKGESQKALAEQAGVCWQTVQTFELGYISPRIDTVEAIFGALGYNIVLQAVNE